MAERLHGWRKLAGSTWGKPRDPQFYGEQEVDVTELLSFLEEVRQRSGVHATVTHAVAKAVAHAMSQVPEMNVRLARGRVYPRESIDLFIVVSAEDGRELTGVKVKQVDIKTTEEVARDVGDRVARIARGDDAEFGRAKSMLSVLPSWLLRIAFGVGAWLTSDLNKDLSGLGMPRQAFGGAMVSSIGMFGAVRGYSMLADYYRIPVVVLVGAVTDRPVVRDGVVVVRPVMSVCATFDHRYVDGRQAARWAEAVIRCLGDPRAHEAQASGAGVARSGGVTGETGQRSLEARSAAG